MAVGDHIIPPNPDGSTAPTQELAYALMGLRLSTFALHQTLLPGDDVEGRNFGQWFTHPTIAAGLVSREGNVYSLTFEEPHRSPVAYRVGHIGTEGARQLILETDFPRIKPGCPTAPTLYETLCFGWTAPAGKLQEAPANVPSKLVNNIHRDVDMLTRKISQVRAGAALRLRSTPKLARRKPKENTI